MQICFRCDDVTNALLEKYAHAYGISKNQLLNSIVQEYLGQNPSLSRTRSTAKTEKELLLELRQANEILARLLAAANDFYFASYYEHAPQESNDSFRLFRTELIGRLADISDRLDRIRKNLIP
ncbi:hypothetical protein D7X87_11080 [bacterium D16-54]|nr:hypothetical protein D7X87_11080 [bacterium D16-54]RKJ14508.1 hypothetical protein D7X65_11675 [bacterium D16-56]